MIFENTPINHNLYLRQHYIIFFNININGDAYLVLPTCSPRVSEIKKNSHILDIAVVHPGLDHTCLNVIFLQNVLKINQKDYK